MSEESEEGEESEDSEESEEGEESDESEEGEERGAECTVESLRAISWAVGGVINSCLLWLHPSRGRQEEERGGERKSEEECVAGIRKSK